MSELVQKGIVQASEDLQRENDEAVWQEGVLRHVPIVGSLYNWINPLQKVSCSLKTSMYKKWIMKNNRNFTAYFILKRLFKLSFQPLIKGRCLSLKEGKLESTESIYTLNTKIDKNDLAPLKVILLLNYNCILLRNSKDLTFPYLNI